MPYRDDDDLFGEDFDFVDEDEIDGSDVDDSEVDSEVEKKPKKKVAKRAPKKAAAKPAKKAPARGKKKKAAPKTAKEPGPELFEEAEPEPTKHPKPEPVEVAAEVVPFSDGQVDLVQADPVDEAPAVAAPVVDAADHVIHIYEHGVLKRSIPRKFTDEEAVTFAEEYSRTGKAYGRRAVALHQDEAPPQMFANAARG